MTKTTSLLCLLIAFPGVCLSQDEDFTIIVIPDTQFYSSSMNGGSPEIFEAQVRWIVENRDSLNVVFVTQLGDFVQNGDEVRAPTVISACGVFNTWEKLVPRELTP